jgi:CRISPR-associated protein Cas2
MFYLICYDIVSDSRRQKVSKLLETCGFRVQKSVFECVLDEKRLEQLQKRLLKLLNKRQDQIRFYPLSASCRSKVIVLGLQPQFAIDDEVFIV